MKKLTFKLSKNKRVKIILNILTLFSIISFPVAIEIISSLDPINYPTGLLDCNFWIFYLFIPVPLISLLFARKYSKIGYDCDKNIKICIFMIFILFIFGADYFVFYGSVSRDYSKVLKLSKYINIDFPTDGQVITEKYIGDNSISSDDVTYSFVTFPNADSQIDFEKQILNSDELWKNTSIDYSELLEPIDGVYRYINNGYFLIYIKELDSYNSLPSDDGNYSVVFFAYNIDEHYLDIYQYKIFYSI